MFYLVLSYKYTEYQINSNIEYLSELTGKLEDKIDSAKWIIEYKTSLSYKNKVLKEEQGLKNKGEKVVYLITESNYEKYTTPSNKQTIVENQNPNLTEQESLINTMSIYEKWIYFLFWKDTRG